MARIAICAYGRVGYELAKYALSQPYPIEFIATSEYDGSPYKEKIEALGKSVTGVRCNSPEFISLLEGIDLVLLLWWPELIKKEALDKAKYWVNLHPSLLPYNRGKHPYYWSIVKGTPFGVTIHLVNEGMDTGDILFQKEIPVRITDTGETLYAKGCDEMIDLFKASYTDIATLNFKPVPQDNAIAVTNYSKYLDDHSCIKLDQQYNAFDLINRLRARTFLNGDSAYFMLDGKKYLIKTIIQETN